MANYKTPGVYIEEITKFPPSVAQVETAIPAFIGYTEKAERLNGDTLNMDPTRITSLLEYETYFGQAQPENITVHINDTVDDDENILSRVLKVDQPLNKSPFLMYYSLQMYFANGGGPCYITSVGQYGDNASPKKTIVNQGELADGLAVIRKEDEPTLLLFPDATNLTGGSAMEDFYALYDLALSQCMDLQDRFTILDLFSDDETADPSPVENFRNNTPSEKDKVKYGAAYYPYLQTILNYRYSESSVLIDHVRSTPNAVPLALKNLEGIAGITINLPDNLNANLGDQLDLIRTITGTGDDIGGSFGDLIKFMVLVFDIYGTPSGLDKTNRDLLLPELEKAMVTLKDLIAVKDQIEDDAKSVAASITENPGQVAAVNAALTDIQNVFTNGTNGIETVYNNLLALQKKLIKDNTDAKVANTISSGTSNIIAELQKLIVASITTGGAPDPLYAYTTDVFDQNTLLLTTLVNAVNAADVAGTDTDNGEMNGRTLDQIVSRDNTVYNAIKVEIDALPLTLPPSSAMAGIYARIDSTRGVWKAPANVGLSYVIKPTVQISHEAQGGLNVDTVAGKSINAIRTFTGKGTLVWGARTLAGNDNEWRYINVRRFFNMVEESVGKASEQFVFEGNDANTWVRVRAMIENFLILQWKAGALAGAKAEQAFYVRVGLGQTMTAQDILEGRMIIEIGMAAVRPAEFIILRFSHKMQEA